MPDAPPPSAGRTRVLFVLPHLARGGSQRFLYELLSALDRDRFDAAVLTNRGADPNAYYDAAIRELGFSVHRRLPLWNLRFWYSRRLFRVFGWLFNAIQRIGGRRFITDLLDQCDVVHAIQIESYYAVQPILAKDFPVLISLMSQRFQYKFNPYDDFERGRRYRMTYFDPSMPREWENTAGARAELLYFPLSMDMRNRPDLSASVRAAPPYRIGVFIRLSPERPMRGLLEAFRDVLAIVDAELWLYGRGDRALVLRELEALGIAGRVVFKGEASDIEATLRADGLTLVWMTSFDTTVGYATLETASLSFPILAWNHGQSSPAEIAARTGGALQSFRDPHQLAQATIDVLNAPERLPETGRRLREWVEQTYDVRTYAGPLFDWLESMARERRTFNG